MKKQDNNLDEILISEKNRNILNELIRLRDETNNKIHLILTCILSQYTESDNYDVSDDLTKFVKKKEV